MEQMPSDEELCIASLADRQSVVAIADDVHSGTDYLPATYPSLVEGPGVRGYIYKKGGKAIAFMSTQLTDGGRTLLETAGRVVKEYRGRGVYGRLQRLVRDRHLGSPHLCYINLALNEISMAVYGQRLLKTYQQVAEKTLTSVELIWFDVSLKLKKIAIDFPGLRILSNDDMASILTSEKKQLYHLFPDGRIILDLKPYRVMAANVPLITNTCTHRVFLATDANSPPLDTDASLLPTVLSAGSYCTCSKGIHYITDLFGEGSDEELRAHITWHLLRSADVGNGNVVFSIFYTRGLDETIADLGKTFPLRTSCLCYKKLIVLEQEFRRGLNDPVSTPPEFVSRPQF